MRVKTLGIASALLLCTVAVSVFAPSEPQPQTPSKPIPLPPQISATQPPAASEATTIPLVQANPPSIAQQPSRPAVAKYTPPVVTSISKKQSKTVVINNKEYPLRTYKALMIPNDPYAEQWWTSSTNIEQAWDIPHGEQGTVLAIIDTGYALQHEEFENRWLVNSGESGLAIAENPSALNCADRGLALNQSCNLIDDNRDTIIDNEVGTAYYDNPSRLNCTDQTLPLTKECNRIDDDGNGLIDDSTGWDFINWDDSVQAGENNLYGEGTNHGTMVAGIAAATGNNGKGLAGIDWATKILPLQALDDDSYGDTLSVGQSIYYAVSRGADVISISLGTDVTDEFVHEAVQYALANGVAVVAASGNDGCDCISYPANHPEVLAVGALNSPNDVASFSSWGKNIDIVAPGTALISTAFSPHYPTNSYASNIAGTSFSTPMVAGMLTRLLSHQPAATPEQLVAALTETAGRQTYPSGTVHNSTLGFGSMDSFAATNRMTTAYNPSLLYSFTPISKGGYLDSSQSAETITTYLPYRCHDNTIGTTQLFELTKPGHHFFSVSKAEVAKATLAGYSSNMFSYACLQLPHDQPQAIRNIDIFQEFRNVLVKQ